MNYNDFFILILLCQIFCVWEFFREDTIGILVEYILKQWQRRLTDQDVPMFNKDNNKKIKSEEENGIQKVCSIQKEMGRYINISISLHC